MKTKVYLAIAFRLILLFGVGMLMTFATPHMREFFGDTRFIKTPTNYYDPIDSGWIWGARHYWYIWLMILLFVLSLINFAMSVYNIIQKNYPDE